MSQKGFAHVFLLIILLVGIIGGVYLVTNGNPLKLFSKASNPPIVFKSSSGQVLPNNTEGLPQTAFSSVRVEFTSPLGSPQLTPTPSPTPGPTSDPNAASRRVFVTSTIYDGNLGGIAGADNKCQTQADLVNLGGSWKAWISASNNGPASTFNKNTGPYKLLDGKTIANNWVDLVDGNLQSSINIDENKVAHSPGRSVWSWTNSDGTPKGDGSHCGYWTITGPNSNDYWYFGSIGSPEHANSQWSLKSPPNHDQNCGVLQHLYCFEQTDAPSDSIPTPEPTPSPEVTSPGDIVYTVSFRYAEDPAALDSASYQPYNDSPVIIDHTFSNTEPGQKFIWVEFKDSSGKTERKSAQVEKIPTKESRFGKSLELRKSSANFSYIKIPGPDVLTKDENFTLEAWVKPTLSNSLNWEAQKIFDNVAVSGYFFSKKLSDGSHQYKYEMVLLDNNCSARYLDTEVVNIARGEELGWKHIALQFGEGSGYIFEDGKVKARNNDLPTTTCDFSEQFEIGGSFTGFIDEVRISNSIRYLEDFTPKTAPFQADDNTVILYQFDNENLGDSSSNRRNGQATGGIRYADSPLLDLSNHPIVWTKGDTYFEAENFYLKIGDKYYFANSRNINITRDIQGLNIKWQEEGVGLELLFNFVIKEGKWQLYKLSSHDTLNNEGSYYIGLDDFTSLGEPRIYSSLNITGESISGDLQTLMHFDNLSVLIKTPATPLPSPTSSLAPTPQPSVDGPKIDLPGPIDIPIPFLPTPTPISIPTPIPTAVPTPLPTPLPVLPAGNNWGTKSELVCKNGEVPAKPERTRLIYTIWPDEPYDLNAPIKFNKTEFSYADPAVQVISIKNRLDISSAYIAVETESGQFLLPTGKVAHRDMTYAQFFGVNMVKWSKGGIPAGYYTIQFQLPNSWCE